MSSFNLSGSWEGPLGTMMNIQQVGNQVTATPANAACSQHWTLGSGTLSDTTLVMSFQGGPAAGTFRGSVSANGTDISWNNGYHWVRRG
jgi:hypothetical protein